LRSFIYANGSQKERLMGAGQTLIAKPWLGEMHITWRGVGEGAMSHELAHLFTQAFGSGPLRLAGPSLLSLNMGLVEGAAEAAAWDGDDLTFHGWAAALYRLDLAPELTEVIGARGFWGQYSRKVYTLMGSFSRWLIDEYGVDRYRRLYGSGDFEGTYQTTPEALVASWRQFLDGLPVSDAQLDLARFRYDRPPIFGKVCARSVAVRVQDSYELAAGHRYQEAAECLEGVVDDDPNNLSYRLRWAELLRQAGAYSRAEGEARRVADAEVSGPVLRARALELLGDVAWSVGDRMQAARFYLDASEAPLDVDALRMITVKLWGVRDEAVSDTVYALLLASPPPPHDGLTLMLADGVDRTGSPLLAYLLGFRLFNGFDYARAADYLERAVTGFASLGLGEVQPGLRAISRQGRLRLAQSQFLSGQIEAARAGFAHLAEEGDVRVDALAASALDWVARCDWALARERQPPGDNL
jgi:tetratricopeptide (TPR) repeat protein